MATNGARLSRPTLVSYTGTGISATSQLTANGNGSVLELPNPVSIVGPDNLGALVNLTASSGGQFIANRLADVLRVTGTFNAGGNLEPSRDFFDG